MPKNLVEAVRLQSEKRHKGIRKVIGERLQGIAEGASSASLFGKLISRVVPREKRVSRDPL